MKPFRAVSLAILLLGPAVLPGAAQKPAASPAPKLQLTVDSIMRGPSLVGWPPTGLRWSADSQHLYFDWRKPGEDEPSTYAVSRDGISAPRKLTDEEAKNVPPASGFKWDKARRRALFADRGDVVFVEGSVRRHVTRTADAESNPR